MNRLALLLLLSSLAGCTMPSTTVRSADTRPSISVANLKGDVDLYLDGVRMGRAADFQEPHQLKVDAGMHRVSIVEAGKTLFEQTVFIESEHKTIVIK